MDDAWRDCSLCSQLINQRTETKILKFTYTLCVGCLSSFFHCHPSLSLLFLMLKEYSLLPLLGMLRLTKEVGQFSLTRPLCQVISVWSHILVQSSFLLTAGSSPQYSTREGPGPCLPHLKEVLSPSLGLPSPLARLSTH